MPERRWALNCDLKLDDWAPIGLVDDDTHTFQGTFEGNGYTVVINVNTNEALAGFFGYLRGTVQNLKVAGRVLYMWWYHGIDGGRHYP